jgi:hypothetical protein
MFAVALLFALPLSVTADIPGGGPRSRQDYQNPPDPTQVDPVQPDPNPPQSNPVDDTPVVLETPQQSASSAPEETSQQRVWISLLLGALALGGGITLLLRNSRSRSR